jgi:hypothetical protein
MLDLAYAYGTMRQCVHFAFLASRLVPNLIYNTLAVERCVIEMQHHHWTQQV